MACAEGLIKLLMWVFNFIVFLLGLGITIIGIMATAASYGSGSDTIKEFNDVIKDQTDQDLSSYGAVGVAVLVFGLIVTLISFLGCCGVWKESKCMLYTFAVVIAIFVIAQLAAGIYAFVQRNDLVNAIKDASYQSLGKTDDTQTGLLSSWSDLQKNFQCCGVENSKDWVEKSGTPFSDKQTRPLWPDSCCQTYAVDCNQNASSTPWPQGCYTKIYDMLEPYILAVGLGCIIFCLIEILAIVFACCLGSGMD